MSSVPSLHPLADSILHTLPALHISPRHPPQYVLVLEELERQYRANSDFFTEDNQCLTDVIMASQANEQEANHYESESNLATGKNAGYGAGRVARGMALDSMKEQAQQRARANLLSNPENLAHAQAQGEAQIQG